MSACPEHSVDLPSLPEPAPSTRHTSPPCAALIAVEQQLPTPRVGVGLLCALRQVPCEGLEPHQQ